MRRDKEGEDRKNRRRKPDPMADLEQAEEILSDLGVNAESPHSTGLRQRAEEWTEASAFEALSEIACSVAANLDLPSLVQQILDIALTYLHAERGLIFMGDGKGGELVPIIARKIGKKDFRDLARVSRTIIKRGRQGEVVFSSDISLDEGLDDIPSLKLNEIRCVVCMPMCAKEEQVGLIYVDSTDTMSAPPRQILRFIEAFASLAAVALENARLHSDIISENRRLHSQVSNLASFGRLVTSSDRMTELLRRAAMAGQADAPVLILGESGTGKELVARAMHEASPRSRHPFIAYNCAAIPKDLLESLFFGHMRGAFTGALRDSPGLFQQANAGVLFLDEIADLDGALQAKLLRVLEDGIIRPLGSEQELQVDFRLITATSKDLYAAIAAGRFREDLFYRMNVLALHIPSLRERREDIPLLVDHFLRKHHDAKRKPPVRITQDAITFLQGLDWPGNVRELENFVRRVLALCEGPTADTPWVRELLANDPMQSAAAERERVGEENAQAQPAAADFATLVDRERDAIMQALNQSGGNKSKAARLLGLHRNSFLRRMERLKIQWKE